jgi:hypothetical protein
VLFVLIGKLCSLNGFERVRTLATSRIYIIFILFAGTYAGAYVTGKGALVEKYIPTLWEISALPTLSEPQQGTASTGEYIYEGSGEILSGSREEPLLSGTIATGTVLTDNTTTGNIATGTILTDNTTTGNIATGTINTETGTASTETTRPR